MQSMIDDYVKKYDDYNKELVAVNEHNKKVKTNLAMLKVAKTIGVLIATGVALDGTPLLIQNGEIPASAIQDYAFLESISAESAEYQAMFQGLEGYSANSINMDFFKVALKEYNAIMKKAGKIDIVKVLDIASKIFGEKMENFVSKNFKEKKPPVKPTMPTATFTEYKFGGKIINDGDTYGPKFYNPGTFKNQAANAPTTVISPYEYPIYNDILGTFAMLETPKIRISETIKNDSLTTEWHEPDPYNTSGGISAYQSWTRSYQFTLDKPLAYYFNPVLDIDKKNVRVAFKVKAKRKLVQPVFTNANLYPAKRCFIDPNFTKNVDATNVNHETYAPLFSLTAYINHENGPALPNMVDIDTVELLTPYFDINAFQNIVGGIGLKNEFEFPLGQSYDFGAANLSQYGYMFEFDIEIKLLIDIDYHTLNDEGETNKLTQLFTYDINYLPGDVLNSDLIVDLENTGYDFTQFKEEIVFFDTDFDGSIVDGCKLSGNNYVCQAWGDITINGDINVSPGYNVEIYSGTLIEVNPEAVVHPEAVLAIIPMLDYSNPMSEATADYVYHFCKGSNPNLPSYSAKAGSKSSSNADEVISNEMNEEQSIRELAIVSTLYPNPASEELNILFNQKVDGLTITMVDLTGRSIKINPVHIADSRRFKIDIKEISTGSYYIKLNSPQYSVVKQVIIKK